MKVLRKMTNNVKWPKDLNMWQMWVLVMTKYLKYVTKYLKYVTNMSSSYDKIS